MNCIEVHDALKKGHRVFIFNQEGYISAHLVHDEFEDTFKLVSGNAVELTITPIKSIPKFVERLSRIGYAFKEA